MTEQQKRDARRSALIRRNSLTDRARQALVEGEITRERHDAECAAAEEAYRALIYAHRHPEKVAQVAPADRIESDPAAFRELRILSAMRRYEKSAPVTRQGAPYVRELEKRLGFDITEQERDELWKQLEQDE